MWTQPQIVLQFLLFTFKSFMEHKGLEDAKSLTYTSLFAVVPLITLIFAILSVFPSFQAFGGQIQEMIFDRLLPSSSSDLENYLEDFANQAKNLTWVGTIMLMAAAYLMLVNVERSFNHIWGVGELRKGLSSFLLYWSVLSLGPILLVIGIAISSYVTSLALFETFSEVSDLVGARSLFLNLFPILLTTLAFTLLYVAVPNCGVKFRHGLIGALTVAVSFTLVKWIFSQFIALASYEFVYGTFAAIPIFLMWIYICWVVILFGANLVRSIPLFSTSTVPGNVHPSLLLIALIHKFWTKQLQGESLHISELMEERWPFKHFQVETFLELLARQKVIRNLKDDEYILVKDLSSITLWDVLSMTPWQQPGKAQLKQPVNEAVASHLPDTEVLEQCFIQIEQVSREQLGGNLGQLFRDDAYRFNKQIKGLPSGAPEAAASSAAAVASGIAD